MDQEKMRKVLADIAVELNREQVLWAVGGSLLLFLKGKTDYFHDIDLMIGVEDAGKVKKILSSMGQLQPENPNESYRTTCFMEFEIQQAEVDVMAGFVIVNNGIEYDCGLKQEDVAEYTTIHSQRIPLASLKQWKTYYQLMGRTEKVKMLEDC